MAPCSTSASGTPSIRSPGVIGWPCGHVFASPIAASMRSSSFGDIACSSRSASSWTSSHGIPRTSVRKRSISRWRRTMPSACSSPLSVKREHLVRPARDVAVALEPPDHLVDRRRGQLHRARDVGARHRQPGLLQPEDGLQVLLFGDGRLVLGHGLEHILRPHADRCHDPRARDRCLARASGGRSPRRSPARGARRRAAARGPSSELDALARELGPRARRAARRRRRPRAGAAAVARFVERRRRARPRGRERRDRALRAVPAPRTSSASRR